MTLRNHHALNQPPFQIVQTHKYSVVDANTTTKLPLISTTEKSRDYDPVDNKLYKTKAYWDERFKTEECREWLGSYDELKTSLYEQLYGRSTRNDGGDIGAILVVGSGNSYFSRDLKRDNPTSRVVSIDFSPTVVHAMSLRDPTTEYLEMDMTRMTFPQESFEVVLDKGSMDALVSDEDDPWNPPDSTCASVDAMMCSVARVLRRRGGVYLQISFQQPHFRMKHLRRGAIMASAMWGG